jgi:hypothetical protein
LRGRRQLGRRPGVPDRTHAGSETFGEDAEGGVVLAFLALWLAVIVVTAVVMAHRGHSWFYWAVVTTAFGPLAWPLAVRELLADRTAVTESPPEGDVLVAVAPWTGSAEPIVDALLGMAPPPRAVTLVTVLDAEDEATIAGRAAADEHEASLRRLAGEIEATGVARGPVRWGLRYGRAADVLAELARGGGHREIVLGPSGSAIHHLLQGHTRPRLAHLTPTRVLEGRVGLKGIS